MACPLLTASAEHLELWVPVTPEYQLLTDLGFDPHDVYKVGAWFRVSEKAVAEKADGGAFAPGKAAQGGRRPVVLASPWGYPFPDLVFFPRTTKRQRRGHPHPRHHHRAVYPECGINKDGTVLDVRVTVKAPELSTRNWLCAEPEPSALYAEMERWLRR